MWEYWNDIESEKEANEEEKYEEEMDGKMCWLNVFLFSFPLFIVKHVFLFLDQRAIYN